MPTKTKSKRNPRPARQARSNGSAHIPSPPPQNDNQWFELRESGIQGLGAFARKDIPKGTRLIEYTGEKISYVESDIPDGLTIGEWRRQRCAAPQLTRPWWSLVRRIRTVGRP